MTTFSTWAIAVLLSVMPMAAAAQTDSGRISGTARDQSGANVAGATVIATNDRTGETRSATTNNEGFFVIAPLKPSTYTIKASKDGFGNLDYPNMPLAVSQE